MSATDRTQFDPQNAAAQGQQNQSEDRGTLEDVVEPYLIQQGYLIRTARGRMASAKGWRHLGLVPPPSQNQPADLFQRDALAGDAADV